MRVVINFLLKLIASVFVGVIIWCCIVLALLMWDKRFMEMENGRTFVWHKPKH